MKRLIVLLLVFVIIIFSMACGRKQKVTIPDDKNIENPEQSDSQIYTYDPDLPITEQQDKINKNNLTFDSIDQIESDAIANGYEIEWAEDGSLLIYEDASTLSTSAIWPEELDFIKPVPIPENGVILATEISESNCTILMDWSLIVLDHYVESLKNAGFSEIIEDDTEGFAEEPDVYIHSLKNTSGLNITVALNNGSGSIVIWEDAVWE